MHFSTHSCFYNHQLNTDWWSVLVIAVRRRSWRSITYTGIGIMSNTSRSFEWHRKEKKTTLTSAQDVDWISRGKCQQPASLFIIPKSWHTLISLFIFDVLKCVRVEAVLQSCHFILATASNVGMYFSSSRFHLMVGYAV